VGSPLRYSRPSSAPSAMASARPCRSVAANGGERACAIIMRDNPGVATLVNAHFDIVRTQSAQVTTRNHNALTPALYSTTRVRALSAGVLRKKDGPCFVPLPLPLLEQLEGAGC